MKYKIGDRVKIKSLDWYNRYTNGTEVDCGAYPFTSDMKEFCGQERIIANVCQECYFLLGIDDKFVFTDEMIEGLVEEEVFIKADDIYNEEYSKGEYCHEQSFKWGFQEGYNYSHENDKLEITLKDGYIFKDENGNVINATKIVLKKKEKEYPKTYEECCKVLGYDDRETYCICHTGANERLFERLYRLKVCRDAYWKIAGEEMGFGKPWSPDYDSGVNKYGIICMNGVIQKSNPTTNWERHLNKILDFPTEEMRDAFYENFDPDIEFCKELL